MNSYTLAEIAGILGATLHGNSDQVITGISTIQSAKPGEITFLHNPHYRKYLADTQASAVILTENDAANCSTNVVVMSNPHYGYAKLAQLFSPKLSTSTGIHPTATIGNECKIPASVSIGARAVIEDGVSIGEGTVISPGCVIGEQTILGANCYLYANVSIYHHTVVGDHVIIQSGAVIGSDGFGFAHEKGMWHKIPHLGRVVIGNQVEIGANTTIDRGALEDTVIEEGVKLDNQIQIAHNVRIGAHTVIAGCTGIAGSTQVGRYCMIGGAVAINGHIKITDKTIIMAGSSVSKSITEPGIYSSALPVQPVKEWNKNVVRLRNLERVFSRIKELEKL